MAALRPGKCYSKLNKRAWTRQSKRKPRKSYVKGVPAQKIRQFEVGNIKEQEKFILVGYILAKQPVQMRSNAIEAARISSVDYLRKKLGSDMNFFFKVLVYPHNVLRENSLATGAGADRFSQGMRRAFGKPIGSAARIKANQRIMMARAAEGKDIIVKEALRRAAMKLSGTCRIVLETKKA